jgi:hypothetical protein
MNERIKSKGSVYSRTHNGWYRIKDKEYYFRSSWEVNYARYLEWLKEKKEIKNWEYESKVFWFEKIKRGVRSYNPDFEVQNKDDSIEYHEVKGWLDRKSQTKIKRMKKYFPNIKLLLIDKKVYFEVIKLDRLFPQAIKIDKNPRIEIEVNNMPS